MEHVVRLGTEIYHDSIYQRLMEMEQVGELSLRIQDSQQGKRWLIECSFHIPEQSEDQDLITKIYSYYLANAVADTIITQFEQNYMRRAWRSKVKGKKVKGLRVDDKEVLSKAIKNLAEGMTQKKYQSNRKTRLVASILTSLEEGKIFDIEGFLRFRAREYLGDLDRAISIALDDYLLEREYLEFIGLLKRYVDTQDSNIDTLHIRFNTQGEFSLLNEEGNEITQQYLEGSNLKEGTGELMPEDLLISSLIQMAPRHLVLHIRFEGYRNTLQTIQNVFSGRVSYCTGCQLCSTT